MPMEIQLLDEARSVLATATVESIHDVYSGTIRLRAMSPRLREIFKRYEEVVNNQALSLLDEIEDEIAAIHITARFDDGSESQLKDVQIFPQAGTVSFKTIREAISLG